MISRLLAHSILAVCVIGTHAVSSPQNQIRRDIALNEVILPHIGNWESYWAMPALLLDPINPSTSSVFSGETLHGPGHSGTNPLWPCQLLWDSSRSLESGMDVSEAYPWGNSPGIPRCALLDGPNGMEFVAMDRKHQPDLKVWDLETGNFLRWLPHPPPLPGKPNLSGFDFLHYAGDVTGDGYGDLLFQDWTLAGDGVVGCLDGQTGQLVWMDYRPYSQNYSRVLPIHDQRQSDIDGDGIRDYVAGFETNKFFQMGHSLTAYSGATGTEIWSLELDRNQSQRHSILCNDLNGDGIADLVSLMRPDFPAHDNGELMAIDGSNGTPIWVQDCTFIQSMHPTATNWALTPLLFTQPSPTGNSTDLVIAGALKDSHGTYRKPLLFIDALTGTPVESAFIDGDLSPWQDDPLSIYPLSLRPIGDYDGDGYQEFAIEAYLTNDDSNSTTIEPTGLAILGQRSLFGPSNPQLGTSHDFHFAFPIHAGASIRLIFSTKFHPRSSRKMWVPDGWPTMLGVSPLLSNTINSPSLRGRLDGAGQSTLSVNFPLHAAYAGIPFYARGLVANPVQPGAIATQTTLLQLTLQP